MKRRLALVHALLLGGAALPLLAQEPVEGGDVLIEEVIVTANRREQSIQDVPMSVTAFTEDFFLDSGVTKLKGLEQYTPNLRITTGTDSRTTSIRIRGIGSVGSNSGIDPSVGIFIDGVYQGRTGMSIGDLIDVERVEVLRGPQGTLYGKNTAAGAISLITRRPGPELEVFGEIIYDSNNQAELRGSVNLPFGESGHAMRWSAYGVRGDYRDENTFTGDGVNNTDKWGARGRFLFDTARAGQWLFSIDYNRENTECCALAVISYDGLSTLNAPLTNNPSLQWQQMLGLNSSGQPILQYNAFENTEGFSPPLADPFGKDYWFNEPFFNKVSFGGASLEWNHELPGAVGVTWINAWRGYHSDSGFDGDYTAYEAVVGSTDVALSQYSSELRFTSPGGQQLDWIGGLYGYYSKFDSVGRFQIEAPLAANIGLDLLFPEGALNTDTNNYTTNSYAAFGQLVWNASDKFSATLGLRYTYEKKRREGSQITEPSSIIDIPPVAGPDIYYDNTRSDNALSPMLNLRYFATPDVMVYGLVSRGFKSGGFNQLREELGSDGEFDEEIATNYELGWKGSWFERQLTVNGTFFLVNYDDFQTQTFDGSSIKVTNAGKMRSYGAELELAWLPTTNWSLGSGIGYTKATYTEFDNAQCTVEQAFYDYYIVQNAQGGSPGLASPPCAQDLSGAPVDNVPEWTVSSYAQYQRDLFDKLVGIARLEHSYIDSFFLDQDLDPNLVNEATNLINLRLALTTPIATWELVFWGRNLLDEQYYAFGIDIPTVGGYAGYTAPRRTYGATLRYRF